MNRNWLINTDEFMLKNKISYVTSSIILIRVTTVNSDKRNYDVTNPDKSSYCVVAIQYA